MRIENIGLAIKRQRERRFIGMKRNLIFLLVLVLGIATVAGAADTVQFKGLSIPEGNSPLLLTGKLMQPEGGCPSPAVVMLHGCSGMNKYYDTWAERLTKWGYVTLQVNSL